ncbi:hypothetical protein OGAPHI_001854 [Ogataea philodendri]|uniref:Methyltransferase domain-containing protein n=1 Tax=Ogataea philodendri TaxID=1378263 RepID=A0A9P8PAB0_9ASCO|nr:uncharacterized protein OGAPHI_001854 [Ogataea philodendri]KAH3668100.1 hypothetical protein OGAPHI_001854 [Ogataea philodendri]
MFSRTDLVQVPEVSGRLSLGMPPAKAAVAVPFAYKVAGLGVPNVLDLGSGKGYMARILANEFALKVCCVDREPDRLRSSLRVHRLIQTEIVTDTTLVPSGKMVTVAGDIADDRPIWSRAARFYRLDTPVHQEIQEVVVAGLQLCGELVYHAADLAMNCPKDQVRVSRLVVVPCCLHRIERLRCSKVTGPNILADTIFADIRQYLLDKGFGEVQIEYLNDGYYCVEASVPG